VFFDPPLNAAVAIRVYSGDRRKKPVNDAPTTPAEYVAPALPLAKASTGSVFQPALAEVHARRGILVRLAYRFCWNLHDAEDAVQSALALATDRQAQLGDAQRAWCWVRAIVVRQWHDLRRRARRAARAQVRLADQARRAELPPQPHVAAATSEFSDRVRAAIARLPERQRTAIVLRHLEELGYAEIAEIMGVSESTARVQVRNARENLRRLLEKL
jgi:RNA polymerase sigma-70 factor (ECF subfamily)